MHTVTSVGGLLLPEKHDNIDGKMNDQVYQDIFQRTSRSSVTI